MNESAVLADPPSAAVTPETYRDRAGLAVAEPLCDFVENEVLPGLAIDARSYWRGVADLLTRLAPRNRALLAKRDALQAKIDAWHVARRGQSHDPAAYRAMLADIGYLVPEPEAFAIDPADVDTEVATTAAPQLVVPIDNARFLLNAANARWGSLYDALYGTDAIPGAPQGEGYDPVRGAAAVVRAKALLDEAVPLASGSHADADGYRVESGALIPALADPVALVGYRGTPAAPSAILLRHHGLHIEIVIARDHRVGRGDAAGVADIVLEAAVTAIADLEDSVATVGAADKVAAYRNWLGLMRGDLTADFVKDGRRVTRTLAPDRVYIAPDGSALALPGRALMFVRNVGHLTTSDALLLADGAPALEGMLDAIVTATIALHDLRRARRNGRARSIYLVKPKLHGPDEAAFADDLFAGVEDLLGLPQHTIKIGLMDEERRTSANLAACIAALRHRIVFANTGFLDRTGDEIHSMMEAGPVRPKMAMRDAAWMRAYEDRNVRIALACGFSGRAQIGKGMWAMPDRMAAMLAAKIAHPMSGADTAWVPSPTAATLHALHYHAIDVAERQRTIAAEPIPPLAELLTLPLLDRKPGAADIARELDTNCQGILGYVSRWVEMGVGCSKVPDLDDIGLMEDRATLRISAQHIANWLHHGICDAGQVHDALARMAARVDAQNAGDPAYRAMAPRGDGSPAFAAATALIFAGRDQPNGYTEVLLDRYRRAAR